MSVARENRGYREGKPQRERGTSMFDICRIADRELIQDHSGWPIIVRFIRAVPVRRIDLRRDARREILMTKHARLLLVDATVNIIAHDRCCDRR